MPVERLDASAVARAAAVLRGGGLVAFPTETVYGLGANALDPVAVARVFAAKGRPGTNPVIVHVAGVEGVRQVAAGWPDAAGRLAERFWPGPLTLVLPRTAAVPDIVTAGGPAVAVRVPDHPLALALLREAGVPVAAPSANRSGRLSPTRAEHVPDDLADAILDGGACPGGIESTVLSLVGSPRLLRPGLVSPAEIEAVIGPVARGGPVSGPLPSPGLLERHYSPLTPLTVMPGAAAECGRLARGGLRVALLTHLGPSASGAAPVESLPATPAGYAAGLYDALHRLDGLGVERIIAEAVPEGEEWLAVRDRLRRASA